MSKVKCRYCGKEVDKENAYNPKTRLYYCSVECYNKSNNPPPKNKNKSDIRLLTDYIRDLYIDQGYRDKDINWGMICKQISNLIKENNKWTYSGIKYTLWYMINIKDMNLFDDNYVGSILNLVPYEYNNARNYHKETQEIKRISEDFIFDEKTITVKKQHKDKIITAWEDL